VELGILGSCPVTCTSSRPEASEVNEADQQGSDHDQRQNDGQGLAREVHQLRIASFDDLVEKFPCVV